ncbi:hypothetical protein RvY_07062-1 [Ramazzottius varieornatus]|uniref:Uncharacterized protein n=1 Tax=Ramazzottius varieornatus TaxID=947166 RepID=A0A1D1VA85_RAMVA|nr:hypothetical protein RvY_07062-1 [Ramazzottius varieornatus]
MAWMREPMHLSISSKGSSVDGLARLPAMLARFAAITIFPITKRSRYASGANTDTNIRTENDRKWCLIIPVSAAATQRDSASSSTDRILLLQNLASAVTSDRRR